MLSRSSSQENTRTRTRSNSLGHGGEMDPFVGQAVVGVVGAAVVGLGWVTTTFVIPAIIATASANPVTCAAMLVSYPIGSKAWRMSMRSSDEKNQQKITVLNDMDENEQTEFVAKIRENHTEKKSNSTLGWGFTGMFTATRMSKRFNDKYNQGVLEEGPGKFDDLKAYLNEKNRWKGQANAGRDLDVTIMKTVSPAWIHRHLNAMDGNLDEQEKLIAYITDQYKPYMVKSSAKSKALYKELKGDSLSSEAKIERLRTFVTEAAQVKPSSSMFAPKTSARMLGVIESAIAKIADIKDALVLEEPTLRP